MIDLAASNQALLRVQAVATDPGTNWKAASAVAIEAPPDGEIRPAPESVWPANLTRTGICGAVSPRVVRFADGTYRVFYTQILPRPGFPAGANDYDNATTRILSAISSDGLTWTPEPGVRLSSRVGGAGEFRVVSAEVVPVRDTRGQLRMYYECCRGSQSSQNSIRSALSDDGGTVWTPEPGIRFEASARNLMGPRIILLPSGASRLYLAEGGIGIISLLSEDGGVTFHEEAGVRIAPDGLHDRHFAFAPEILRVAGRGYRMYYAGYGSAARADILTAVSEDGLRWHKEADPVLSPGNCQWDAAKCSETCVYPLPRLDGQSQRYGMLYEACDGTAADRRGVWRIASALAVG